MKWHKKNLSTSDVRKIAQLHVQKIKLRSCSCTKFKSKWIKHLDINESIRFTQGDKRRTLHDI